MWKYEGKNVHNGLLDDALDALKVQRHYQALSQADFHIRDYLPPKQEATPLPHTYRPVIAHIFPNISACTRFCSYLSSIDLSKT